MTREELIEKIKDVISETADISREDIHEDSAIMDDLELSSLETLTTIGELETMLSIHMKMKDYQGIITIGDLADCLLNNIR